MALASASIIQLLEGGGLGSSALRRGIITGLHRGNMGLTATRDYANNLLDREVATMDNTDSIFSFNMYACTGRVGRGILKISGRALSILNTISTRATVRVTRNTEGISKTSLTMDAAKVTNPANKAPRGPINLICYKVDAGSGDCTVGLVLNNGVGVMGSENCVEGLASSTILLAVLDVLRWLIVIGGVAYGGLSCILGLS